MGHSLNCEIKLSGAILSTARAPLALAQHLVESRIKRDLNVTDIVKYALKLPFSSEQHENIFTPPIKFNVFPSGEIGLILLSTSVSLPQL